MPAFGSSSKTGRLPPDKPRRDPSASSSSTGASSLASSRASLRAPSTREDRGGDVRAASRAPKPALAPATPSPTSHAPSTRPRAPVPPGRDPPPSARGSPTPSRRWSPARTQASASAETKKAARVREGIAAVRNLLFEEGPKTYCAVDTPSVSAGRRGVSSTPSPIDPIDPIDPIEAPSAPRDALALALRVPSDNRLVDASTLASSTRLAELRLADETWRRVAFRIARTGGARGDALAASAREVFRRLAAAMPPETSETTRPRCERVSFARGDVSPRPSSASRLLAPLLLDRGDGDDDFRGLLSGLPRTHGFRFRKVSTGFPGVPRSSPSARAATTARAALAVLALVALGASLASVALLAAFHARGRSTSVAFEPDAPPPS